MTRVDSGRRIEPDRAGQVLRAWFERRAAGAVEFGEVIDPENDPTDGYVVAYEASFTPKDLTQARIEVWVTDDGHVAVGFERKKRVAERLGVKRVGYDWFAAGLEPVEMEEAELVSLLNLAANGRISLKVVMVPLVGVLTMKAFVPHGTKKNAGLDGSSFHWLREKSKDRLHLAHVLDYEPWSE